MYTLLRYLTSDLVIEGHCRLGKNILFWNGCKLYGFGPNENNSLGFKDAKPISKIQEIHSFPNPIKVANGGI